MQETNRPELEDAQRFRRVWQRVQGGREEAELAAEETAPPAQPSGPWEPTAFLQDAIARSRLRGNAYRQWGRLLPLAEDMLALLRRACEGKRSEYIFGNGTRPADPRTIQRRLQRLIQRAGMRNVHFHTLRHSFATRLMELGVDVKTVSALLGHSSTRITLDFYAHSLIDQQRHAVERLAERTWNLP